MKKPKSSRAIIIKNKKILLMHRKKTNREYYTLIGGKLENFETPEETLIREVKEEASLDLISFKKFTEIEDEQKYATYFIVGKYIGEPKLGGEELDKDSPVNQYKLEWIKLDEIKKINLIPIQIKNKILETFL